MKQVCDLRDKGYLRNVRNRKIERKNILAKQYIVLNGMRMTDSIQRRKHIVTVDYVN